MKKIFFAVLALATMAACNKTEVVSVSEGNAIAFDNAFVDNATKSVVDPSFTNDNMFTDFAVYGFVEGAVLFDGTRVSKDITHTDLKKAWKYAGTQYWIAGAKYNFCAIAPKTGGNWSNVTSAVSGTAINTELSFTNNGTQDLLYAEAPQGAGQTEGNVPVAFTFKHILSKVKFSFENGYNASTATIKVKNVKVTNAHTTANVALTSTTATWSGNDATTPLELSFGMATDDEATNDVKENAEVAYAFGKVYESQNELFLIPSTTDYTYNVTFDVVLLVNTEEIKTYNHTATVTFAPAPGNSYDIKAVINAENIDPEHEQEPIEFTVTTISGWEDNNSKVDTPSQNN